MITWTFSFIERLIYGSEKLFKWIIKSEIKNNLLFFEIGSSDGAEAKLIINSNKKTHVVICEPDKRNINKYDLKIKNNPKVNIINKLISDRSGYKNFYFHKKLSNLNQTQKPSLDQIKYFEKKKIISSTLKNEFNKYKNYKYIIIKMDIEGYEYDLLKKNLNFLKKKNNIGLLIELHPTTYKNREMERLMEKIISYGFKFKYVESAGSIIPEIFKQKKYLPFKKSAQRGLYENLDTKFVIENGFKQKKIKESKVIRSVFLKK